MNERVGSVRVIHPIAIGVKDISVAIVELLLKKVRKRCLSETKKNGGS